MLSGKYSELWDQFCLKLRHSRMALLLAAIHTVHIVNVTGICILIITVHLMQTFVLTNKYYIFWHYIKIGNIFSVLTCAAYNTRANQI